MEDRSVCPLYRFITEESNFLCVGALLLPAENLVLTAADLCICSSGEPVAAGRWLCERLGHSHQGGLDT